MYTMKTVRVIEAVIVPQKLGKMFSKKNHLF